MGLFTFSEQDAYEYVFQKYVAKLNKWMPQAFTGKPKPKLGSVIADAAKTIGSLGLTPAELGERYVRYRLSGYKGAATTTAREAYVGYYGLDTLTGPVRDVVDVFVREGWK